MASDLSFVQFVVDQIGNIGAVSFRKMFGEYAIYVDDKIVALVCDNQLFVKPTEGGRAFIGEVVEAPPYPGAKNSFVVGDRIDDSEWLRQLIRITAKELPAAKAKKSKQSKAKKAKKA